MTKVKETETFLLLCKACATVNKKSDGSKCDTLFLSNGFYKETQRKKRCPQGTCNNSLQDKNYFCGFSRRLSPDQMNIIHQQERDKEMLVEATTTGSDRYFIRFLRGGGFTVSEKEPEVSEETDKHYWKKPSSATPTSSSSRR